MPSMNHYTETWQTAKQQALASGKTIVEHGWEQHVIVDEDQDLVYRYPRHASAAAKLEDEVEILRSLRSHKTWPIAIPELLDYDGRRAVYNYIPGDILDQEKLSQLNQMQLENIGRDLGEFMATLHSCDPKLVVRRSWKQPGTLINYYKNRIELSDDTNPWKNQAQDALAKLHHLQKHDELVLVHGDLHGLNMIISPDGEHLVGVIDLSEIELGDPHQDFRKIFMAEERLLQPAIDAYATAGGKILNPELVKFWAYVNEWANMCYFANDTANSTYLRALSHLKKWHQITD